jgi:predicted kinase
VSSQVYARLMRRAEAVVRGGGSVVCDGTFLQAEGRERLRAVARRHRASIHVIECVAPKSVAVGRIRRRLAAGTDLSEARPALYDRMAAGWEPPTSAWPADEWTRLPTTAAPRAVADAALARLRTAWAVPR